MDEAICFVLFKWRLSCRKINCHSNLFPLIANVKLEQCFAWDSVSCILQTTVFTFFFSLKHGSSLHESQRPTDLKPNVSSFYLSLVLGKKPKSLTCVSLILADNACDLPKFASKVYDVYKYKLPSLALAMYVSATCFVLKPLWKARIYSPICYR